MDPRTGPSSVAPGREVDRLERVRRLYAMLANTHEAILAANDTEDLLAAVCRAAVAHGGVRMAWAAVVDDEGRLRPVVSSGRGYARHALIALHGAAGGLVDVAATTGRPVVEQTLEPAPGEQQWRGLARGDRLFAVGAFPIVVDGRVVATLAAYAAEADFFDTEGLDLFERLAASVAFTFNALTRDRQRRRAQAALVRGAAEAHRRAQQQAAVAELGRRALGGARLDDLMADAAAEVANALGVRVTSIMELVGETLLWRAGEWPGSQSGNLSIRVRPGTQAAYALEAHSVVVADDLDAEERFVPSTILRAMRMRSCMSVVIRVGGQPFGLINAASPRPSKFTVDDCDFVESIAHVLSAAIERRRVELAIRTKALHDPLTGLPNRSLLLDRLNHALRRLRRTDACLALLFADVDRFKLINDTFGHAGGDRLLAALADRLRGSLRPDDTVARLGGDEFVVICEGLGRPNEAELAAERLARALNAPFVIDGQEVFVTLSVGVHVVTRDEAEASADLVLRDADIAMYQAKERGRARYEVFSSALRESASDRRSTESALRSALGRDEFHLLYQPVVTVSDGALIGVEALVRWDRPEFGVVEPHEFISVAEDIGVVVPIGSWVLERACRQAALWARGRHGFFMSVNISSRQMREPSLVSDVSRALRSSGLDASELCLELKETTVMEDTRMAGQIMGQLKDLGVRLAIDDFGTGYSSFAALKRLPIDVLKVDRTFVDGVDADGEDHDIVETILRLADVLGLRAVAEGVERTDQLSELQRLGCWAAQGYHIAPPRDALAVDPMFALAAG